MSLRFRNVEQQSFRGDNKVLQAMDVLENSVVIPTWGAPLNLEGKAADNEELFPCIEPAMHTFAHLG
jgi:hypothetical protein